MADLLDEFTSQAPVPSTSQPPPDAPPQQGGGAPSSPELESLRQELGFTRNLVTQMMQRGQEGVPSSNASTAPALTPVPSFPETFFTEDDVKMILNAPEQELHQRLNRGIKAAIEPLTQELRKKDEQIQQMAQANDQRFHTFAQQRQQEDMRAQFFAAYPELRGEDFLVQQAVQQVAVEAQQQPWAYQQPQQLFQRVAEMAQGLRQQYVQRWQQGDAPAGDTPASLPAAPSNPARRARVETGGSTRVGSTPQRSDPQHKAMDAMIAHVRGR